MECSFINSGKEIRQESAVLVILGEKAVRRYRKFPKQRNVAGYWSREKRATIFHSEAKVDVYSSVRTFS